MADKFELLQNGFYNQLMLGLGFQKGDPFQVVQPSPPIAGGKDADKLLWNYYNNIPPFSLTQNFIQSGGNQFFSDYTAMLSALTAGPNKFREKVGEGCYAAWNAYMPNIPMTTPIDQFPMIFRNWAMRTGYMDVAIPGATAYAAMLLNPIFYAQNSILQYKNPEGQYLNPDWDAGYEKLMQLLEIAPSRSFSLNSAQMDSNISSSWTRGSQSAFFGLWSDSSYKSSYSSEFAASEVEVQASFSNVLQFAAVPGKWYYSAAMGNAYSHKNEMPWIPDNPINWNNTFDAENGNMARFSTNLIVVNEMHIIVNSKAVFKKEDQEIIQKNSHRGMWPFYSKNDSSSSTTTSVSFTKDGMHIAIDSKQGVPVIIGVSVLPVDKFVGHSVEGAKMYESLKQKESVLAH